MCMTPALIMHQQKISTRGLDSVLHHSGSSRSKLQAKKHTYMAACSLGLWGESWLVFRCFNKAMKNTAIRNDNKFWCCSGTSTSLEANWKGVSEVSFFFPMLIPCCYCSYSYSHCWHRVAFFFFSIVCNFNARFNLSFKPFVSAIQFQLVAMMAMSQVAALPGEQTAVQLVSSPAGAEETSRWGKLRRNPARPTCWSCYFMMIPLLSGIPKMEVFHNPCNTQWTFILHV